MVIRYKWLSCFISAEIQASLVLQKPISLLGTNAARLENDILEEIGIPNTKVVSTLFL